MNHHSIRTMKPVEKTNVVIEFPYKRGGEIGHIGSISTFIKPYLRNPDIEIDCSGTKGILLMLGNTFQWCPFHFVEHRMPKGTLYLEVPEKLIVENGDYKIIARGEKA